MRRDRPARAIVAALAALVSLAAVGTTAGAAPVGPSPLAFPPGFYSVPYSDALLWARQVGPNTWNVTHAGPAEWQSQGYPAPIPVGAVYERSPWQDVIVATPQLPLGWGHLARTRSTGLTYEQWARAGFPTPRVTTGVPGMRYFKLTNTSIVYATNVWAHQSEAPHALTYAEWAAAGSPTPSNDGWSSEVQVYGWSTSPELFLSSFGTLEKLTYARWVAIGQPAPTVEPAGFYKLAWTPEIAFVDGDAGEVLTFGDWVDEGFPTPLSVPTIPGDAYCHDAAAGVVRYDGHTFAGDLDPATAEARLGVPVAQMGTC